MKSILLTVFGFVATIVATLLYDYLEPKLEMVLALAFSCLVAGVFWGGMFFLLEYAPRHWRSLRRMLDDRAVVEGQWFEIIPDLTVRPYSIIHIRYDKATDSYSLHGRNYTPYGEQMRRFSADHVGVIVDHNRIVYYYFADRLVDDDAHVKKGMGFAEFGRIGDIVNIGDGAFADLDEVAHEFGLRRITSDDIRIHCRQRDRNFLEVEDYPQFVRSMHHMLTQEIGEVNYRRFRDEMLQLETKPAPDELLQPKANN